MKTPICFTALAALAMTTLTAPHARPQESGEDEDLHLLREAVQLLEKAKLSHELEDRRISQDREALSQAEDAIEQARGRLRQLQASGIIPREALSSNRRSSTDGEGSGNSTDVLGPEAEKATKAAPGEDKATITIEASKRSVANRDEGILVFEEDVFMTIDGNLTVRCDKLEVYLDETRDRVKRAIASGRMVAVDGTNEKGEPVKARCQLAIYERDRMYLRLWPEVSMPRGWVKAADKATYFELIVGEDGIVDLQIHGGPSKAAFKSAEKKPDTAKETP